MTTITKPTPPALLHARVEYASGQITDKTVAALQAYADEDYEEFMDRGGVDHADYADPYTLYRLF